MLVDIETTVAIPNTMAPLIASSLWQVGPQRLSNAASMPGRKGRELGVPTIVGSSGDPPISGNLALAELTLMR
jgi:hypothetical protein